MLNTRITTRPTVSGDAIVDNLDEDSFQGFNSYEQSTPRRHGPVVPRRSFHPYHRDHLRPELRPSSSSSGHWDPQSHLSEIEYPPEYDFDGSNEYHGGGGGGGEYGRGGSTEYHGGGGEYGRGGSMEYHGGTELQNPLSILMNSQKEMLEMFNKLSNRISNIEKTMMSSSSCSSGSEEKCRIPPQLSVRIYKISYQNIGVK